MKDEIKKYFYSGATTIIKTMVLLNVSNRLDVFDGVAHERVHLFSKEINGDENRAVGYCDVAINEGEGGDKYGVRLFTDNGVFFSTLQDYNPFIGCIRGTIGFAMYKQEDLDDGDFGDTVFSIIPATPKTISLFVKFLKSTGKWDDIMTVFKNKTS